MIAIEWSENIVHPIERETNGRMTHEYYRYRKQQRQQYTPDNLLHIFNILNKFDAKKNARNDKPNFSQKEFDR